MAESGKIRLFKIASEINIGKDAIVDFLQNKGFDIENKPTTVLTSDMCDAIYEKFKRERQAAEKQREKIEKQKQLRHPAEPRAIQDKVKHEEKAKIEEKPRHEEQVEISKKEIHEEIVKEVVPEKIEKKEAPSVTKKEPERIIIDLDAIEKSTKVKPRGKSKKGKGKGKEKEILIPGPEVIFDYREEKYEVPSENLLQEEKEKIEVKELELKTQKGKIELEHEGTFDEHAVTRTKNKEEKPTAKEAGKIDKATSVPVTKEKEIPETGETKEIIKESGGEKVEETEAKAGEEAKGKSRRRRRRKKLAEVEYDSTLTPKLRGLTIVGKIDLNKENFIEGRDKKVVKRKFGTVEEEDLDAKDPTKFLKSKKKIKPRGKEKIIEKIKFPDRKKKKRFPVRELVSPEDVDNAIKKTLAGMEESSFVSQRSKLRQRKRLEREEKEQRKLTEIEEEGEKLQLTEFVTTNDLAAMMKVPTNDIIIKCMELGLMVSINQRLDKDTIVLIADDYGYQVEFLDEKAIQMIEEIEEADKEEDLVHHAPIVTVMGHVDHGKTSLLDFIRNTNVVAGEAGGITQHIGAYRVRLSEGKYITFLDTPGHEAFTAMRARGAQVTNIVVLVVAADDSVMPQTIEAISHALAANVPIVVAINKIDKPDAKPERIRQQLADHQILVEDWGGKYQCVEISAKAGTNVETLLEKILLEAEILDLKANPDRNAKCPVVEANMDKGFGPVATVIIQRGTLRVGDPFVCGVQYGRVRAMFDERSNKVDEAAPSIPVRVIGFNGLPEAGDILSVVNSDVEARAIANERAQLKREQSLRQVHHVTLDDISKQIQIGGVKDLNLIIKTDVSGSLEALSDSLYKLSRDEVRINILYKGVGSITESDVMLAVASNAVIIGFQVSPTAKARKLAEKEAVDVRLYSIIYDAINEVRLALEGLLSPELREDITSTVEVRKVFKISKLGAIAGCFIQNGKITRNDRVRLLREGLPVFNGTIHSLKRNKDDVKEVESGFECGIMLDGFHEFEIGDIIESYKLLEIKRTFS